MKLIVVIIPQIHIYRIISEKYFINGNEFRTQNTIIQILDLLGFKDYTVDLIHVD